MKDFSDKPDYAPAGFFALRTPLLPLAEWCDWGKGLQADEALGGGGLLEEALAQDRVLLRRRLQSAMERPEVREAVFVAAPSFSERIHFWRDAPDSPRGQKIEHVLVRFFGRMSARPTPFGLFAGLSTGMVGDESRLAITHRNSARRHTRLDAGYLHTLMSAVEADPSLQDELTYRPNTSLCFYAGQVRYVQAKVKGENRSYHLVALDSTSYVSATLKRAEAGATAKDLAAALTGEEIKYAQAHRYVADLIAAQVLVSDLAPAVTGPESIHQLIAELQKHEGTRAASRVLVAARDAAAALDRDGVGSVAGTVSEL